MRRWPSARALSPITAVALLVVSGACAGSREPHVVTIPQSGVRPVRHIDSIHDYRSAVAAIVHVLEQDLGFPPFPVAFRFYPTRDAFQAALVEVGYDPSFARTTAHTMTAVGGYRGVLLNESTVARMAWPHRTALLAHELTHSLQYEWGGGRRGTSDQWLREGFADWVSVRVLERLDGASLSSVRRQRQDELRRSGRANLPQLSEMVTFRQWVELGATRGAAAYGLALVAVDVLIAEHGMDSVVDYFARFARSQDRTANFRAAFGSDLDAFEATLRARLWDR